MASSSKTEKLGLNQWSGDDKPKREDFNGDNEILETLVGTHVFNDTVHVTPEEKNKINTYCYVGTYYGDGAADFTVEIGFKPKAVFVFPVNKPFSVHNTTENKLYNYAAAAIGGFHTIGLSIVNNGFVVSHSGTAVQGDWNVTTNRQGWNYMFVALK